MPVEEWHKLFIPFERSERIIRLVERQRASQPGEPLLAGRWGLSSSSTLVTSCWRRWFGLVEVTEFSLTRASPYAEDARNKPNGPSEANNSICSVYAYLTGWKASLDDDDGELGGCNEMVEKGEKERERGGRERLEEKRARRERKRGGQEKGGRKQGGKEVIEAVVSP